MVDVPNREEFEALVKRVEALETTEEIPQAVKDALAIIIQWATS